MKNLSEEDRRAVDLLLDRRLAAAGNGSGMDSDGMNAAMYTPHAPVGQDRIERVERLLDVLNLLPAEEPPPGLVERTLAFVQNATGDVTEGHLPFRPPAMDSVSHA